MIPERTWNIIHAVLLGVVGILCLCFALALIIPLNLTGSGPTATTPPTAASTTGPSSTPAVPSLPPEWTATFTPAPSGTLISTALAPATESITEIPTAAPGANATTPPPLSTSTNTLAPPATTPAPPGYPVNPTATPRPGYP